MNNRFASRMLFSAVLASSLFCARAQQPAVPPTTASLSAVDAMQLYLVVHDKKDKPVLDLKPDDLTLTEDGAPARLDHLRLVDQHQDPKQLVNFVFDPFLEKKADHPQKNSSRIESARDGALKILSMLSDSGFEFSVFNIETRLHLLQGYTSDLNAVEAAIQSATGPLASRDKDHSVPEKDTVAVALSGADSAGKPVSAPDRLRAQSIYAALRNSSRIAQDRHISPSLSSLLALVQSQQNLTGRKTIVYFSSIDQAQIDQPAKQAIETIVGQPTKLASPSMSSMALRSAIAAGR